MERGSFFTLICFLLLVFSHLEFSQEAHVLAVGGLVSDGQTLVSALQTFELGFFSPGKSRNRYLGIWYKNSPEAVVWVANRNNPIADRNGVLTVSDSGNLVLLNRTKSVVWSSNVSGTAKPPVAVARLLDTGNLVLKDNKSKPESYLWESFDSPSDTLLAGMKIGWNLKTGEERYLTSWRSVDDPSPGNFTYRLDITGLPQLVIGRGLKKMYRTGPWNGIGFGAVPAVPDLVFKPTVISNENEIYYTFKTVGDTINMRLRLNQSGYLQRLLSDRGSDRWGVLYSVPFDQCGSYGFCGANSVCSTRRPDTCKCIQGFIPESQWSTNCVRESSLDCQKGEGFLRLVGVKVPDLSKIYSNENLNPEQCAAECLKNCSCTAYANLSVSDGHTSCLMWFGDLVDISEVSEVYRGEDVFIRLSSSSLVLAGDSSTRNRLTVIILVSIISGLIILGLAVFIIWRKSRKRDQSLYLTRLEGGKDESEVPLFDLSSIEIATDNFSFRNLIGKGGFGPVYKGNLPTGQEIAVKRLSKDSGEERMLIYEYMPNKSLDCLIFDHKRRAQLSWKNRIIGGNDEETTTSRVVGTYGYMAPEYAVDGTFSVKSDVFSFGVVLLEIVSGKRNRGYNHPDHRNNLLGHAWLLWNEDRALELMDTVLEESCVKSEVLRDDPKLEACEEIAPELFKAIQQSLCSIFSDEGFNFFIDHEGSSIICHRLSHMKVLVVLDDVDNIQHLKCLVGRRVWFGLESRIIVITRDEHLLRSYRIDDVYKPTALNDNDAFRLFNLKAFDSDTVPGVDFIELSKHIGKYAGGLPLALEVLGSFSCGRDATQWRSAIERLKRDSNKEILDRLKISFDGLEEREKNIFLDIPCFFNRGKKDFVMKILDGCDFFADIGIEVLVTKSLIKVVNNNYLWMHDLLQEMGRKIVREKTIDEPGKRYRLWEECDV
ncbi:hypothetical protein V6N13_147580 [Hibiscus sabdariffa]